MIIYTQGNFKVAYAYKYVQIFDGLFDGLFDRQIKVLCEQTREANKRIKIFFWIMFNISWFWEYCGWFPCLEYEEINQQKILV